MSTQRLFVEAGSIAEKNMSGIGHTTLHIIKSLATNRNFQERFELVLIVPFNKVHFLDAHSLPESIKIRRLFLPGKVVNGLTRFNFMPFMDIFFGKGIYLFPNFKNWPLLFSKNITYIHDVYFRVAPEHIEKKNLNLLQKHTERFIRRSSKVVTVSNHAKSEIERFYPGSISKVSVVYNGIDHGFYYERTKAEQAEVAKKYGLSIKRYFMFLSNIEPRKNVGKLLDAYKVFADAAKDQDVALLLVGGMGWGNEVILAKIDELQRAGYAIVKPSIYVPDADLPALLSGSLALVHPALYEGFGISPLQAMACGAPVIVGKNSSLPEVMGETFNDYVDILNSKDIAQKMLYHYNKKDVNVYGVERSREFSWERSAQQLYEVLEEI